MLKKEEHLPPQEMADLVTNTLELYIEDNREDDNLDTPRLKKRREEKESR